MPFNYARRLTGHRRTSSANRLLGYTLAGVAGAINAGGFLAVQQYTSHMTGIVSSMADNVAVGTYRLVLGGAGALLSFIVGAACTAVLVNHARRRGLHSEYALPLLLEAVLLLCFGLLGARLSVVTGLFVPVTVMLLCFIMGLQNALITKLSRAEIRTTHITGMLTDIGIEIGRLFYWNSVGGAEKPDLAGNRGRLRVLSSLVACFFLGGVVGALGFQWAGFVATVPLALALITFAIVPAVDDLKLWASRARQ